MCVGVCISIDECVCIYFDLILYQVYERSSHNAGDYKENPQNYCDHR